MTGTVLEWNGTTWVPKASSETSDTTQPANLTSADLAEMQKRAVQQTMQPMQATTAMMQPTAADFVPVDAGMTVPIAPFAEAATVGNVQQAVLPTAPATNLAGVTSVAPQVATEAAKLQAATGTPTQQITAQQQVGTSITGMEAAQGNAIKVDGPQARKLETDPVSGESEIISGAANDTTCGEDYLDDIGGISQKGDTFGAIACRLAYACLVTSALACLEGIIDEEELEDA